MDAQTQVKFNGSIYANYLEEEEEEEEEEVEEENGYSTFLGVGQTFSPF